MVVPVKSGNSTSKRFAILPVVKNSLQASRSASIPRGSIFVAKPVAMPFVPLANASGNTGI